MKVPISTATEDIAMMMPEMDGPEFCRRVRENSEYSHLPFVMLTAKISMRSVLSLQIS